MITDLLNGNEFLCRWMLCFLLNSSTVCLPNFWSCLSFFKYECSHDNLASSRLWRLVTRSGCDRYPICGGRVRNHCRCH
uniref:Uncharacterized protein n=1 Tax=Physcomitrium patens TaxID=3218 RepID=A0A2K1JHM4_PHYPA|nr:hypothetical protein PHYPA_018199 [Physcomitrium patens]